jgi:protein NrfC
MTMKNMMNLENMKNEGVENVSSQERRDFLKMGLAITGMFAGGTLFSAVSTFSRAHASDFAKKYPYKPHYSMVMQQSRCIDCERCVQACKETNHVPDAHGAYRTTILEKETPDALGGKREFIPVLCNQCNLPQCTRVCPTKATYKDKKTGIVLMDIKKCIGCLTCQEGCPYNARYFDEHRHAVDKCNFSTTPAWQRVPRIRPVPMPARLMSGCLETSLTRTTGFSKLFTRLSVQSGY